MEDPRIQPGRDTGDRAPDIREHGAGGRQPLS